MQLLSVETRTKKTTTDFYKSNHIHIRILTFQPKTLELVAKTGLNSM